MRQQLIVVSISVCLLLNSTILLAQRRSRGRGRAEQIAALDAIQKEINTLKTALEQDAAAPPDWRTLSQAQRDQLLQQSTRLRAERESALERIGLHTLKLQGTRDLRTDHEKMIRKLTALQGLAETGQLQAAVECLAFMIRERQAAFDAQMRALQGDVEVVTPVTMTTEKRTTFQPGTLWTDNNGVHINAHGGGILYHLGRYYWFGEHKIAGPGGNSAQVGVHCYGSTDLYNWTDEGIALTVSEDPDSDIVKGCVIERPKVIYNTRTQKFVMWFHLELRGQGYNAARTGVAVSDHATGPYRFLHSLRPNAGIWPREFTQAQKEAALSPANMDLWSTQGRLAVKDGALTRRDYAGGQMSRDMALFVDRDGKAYHIHAAEENITLHISELSDDYLSITGRWTRVFPGGHNEAPALFRHADRYYLLTSGCTGWAPNAARAAVADSIWGPWQALDNPCVGVNPQTIMGPELTFGGQSTYVLPVAGRTNAFIAMFDLWRPENPIDGRYLWLPVSFTEEAGFEVRWRTTWDLSHFDGSGGTSPTTRSSQ